MGKKKSAPEKMEVAPDGKCEEGVSNAPPQNSLLTTAEYRQAVISVVSGLEDASEEPEKMSKLRSALRHLLQARFDAPLVLWWTFTAVEKAVSLEMISKEPLEFGMAILEFAGRVFNSLKTLSAVNASGRMTLSAMAPIVGLLFDVASLLSHSLRLSLKQKVDAPANSVKTLRKLRKKLKESIKTVLSFTFLCHCRDSKRFERHLSLPPAPNVPVNNLPDFLYPALPLASKRMMGRLSRDPLNVAALADIVAVEALLLQLCVEIIDGRGKLKKKEQGKSDEEKSVFVQNLKQLAVHSVWAAGSGSPFEMLLDVLLEKRLAVLDLLDEKEEILMREVLYEAVLLDPPNFSLFNSEDGQAAPSDSGLDHPSVLFMKKLSVARRAADLFRSQQKQAELVTLFRRVATWRVPSELLDWLKFHKKQRIPPLALRDHHALTSWMVNTADKSTFKEIFDKSTATKSPGPIPVMAGDYDNAEPEGNEGNVDAKEEEPLFFLDTAGATEAEANAELAADVDFTAAAQSMKNDKRKRKKKEKKKQPEVLYRREGEATVGLKRSRFENDAADTAVDSSEGDGAEGLSKPAKTQKKRTKQDTEYSSERGEGNDSSDGDSDDHHISRHSLPSIQTPSTAAPVSTSDRKKASRSLPVEVVDVTNSPVATSQLEAGTSTGSRAGRKKRVKKKKTKHLPGSKVYTEVRAADTSLEHPHATPLLDGNVTVTEATRGEPDEGQVAHHKSMEITTAEGTSAKPEEGVVTREVAAEGDHRTLLRVQNADLEPMVNEKPSDELHQGQAPRKLSKSARRRRNKKKANSSSSKNPEEGAVTRSIAIDGGLVAPEGEACQDRAFSRPQEEKVEPLANEGAGALAEPSEVAQKLSRSAKRREKARGNRKPGLGTVTLTSSADGTLLRVQGETNPDAQVSGDASDRLHEYQTTQKLMESGKAEKKADYRKTPEETVDMPIVAAIDTAVSTTPARIKEADMDPRAKVIASNEMQEDQTAQKLTRSARRKRKAGGSSSKNPQEGAGSPSAVAMDGVSATPEAAACSETAISKSQRENVVPLASGEDIVEQYEDQSAQKSIKSARKRRKAEASKGPAECAVTPKIVADDAPLAVQVETGADPQADGEPPDRRHEEQTTPKSMESAEDKRNADDSKKSVERVDPAVVAAVDTVAAVNVVESRTPSRIQETDGDPQVKALASIELQEDQTAPQLVKSARKKKKADGSKNLGEESALGGSEGVTLRDTVTPLAIRVKEVDEMGPPVSEDNVDHIAPKSVKSASKKKKKTGGSKKFEEGAVTPEVASDGGEYTTLLRMQQVPDVERQEGIVATGVHSSEVNRANDIMEASSADGQAAVPESGSQIESGQDLLLNTNPPSGPTLGLISNVPEAADVQARDVRATLHKAPVHGHVSGSPSQEETPKPSSRRKRPSSGIASSKIDEPSDIYDVIRNEIVTATTTLSGADLIDALQSEEQNVQADQEVDRSKRKKMRMSRGKDNQEAKEQNAVATTAEDVAAGGTPSVVSQDMKENEVSTAVTGEANATRGVVGPPRESQEGNDFEQQAGDQVEARPVVMRTSVAVTITSTSVAIGSQLGEGRSQVSAVADIGGVSSKRRARTSRQTKDDALSEGQAEEDQAKDSDVKDKEKTFVPQDVMPFADVRQEEAITTDQGEERHKTPSPPENEVINSDLEAAAASGAKLSTRKRKGKGATPSSSVETETPDELLYTRRTRSGRPLGTTPLPVPSSRKKVQKKLVLQSVEEDD